MDVIAKDEDRHEDGDEDGEERYLRSVQRIIQFHQLKRLLLVQADLCGGGGDEATTHREDIAAQQGQ